MSSNAVARYNTRLHVLYVTAFALVVAVVSLLEANDKRLLLFAVALCVTEVIGGIVVVLFAWAVRWNVDTTNPVASVADGMLSLRVGDETGGAWLTECEWWLGRLSECNIFGPQIHLPRRDAVIISARFAPPLGRKYRVAVGMSEELREVWIAFLELAGVPRKDPKKVLIGSPPVVSVFSAVLWPYSL